MAGDNPVLYLDGIFSSVMSSPSSVRLSIPNPSDKGFTLDLVGLIIGDPTFSTQNKWGTVINDVSNLTDVTALLGTSSMFTWINASTMCWKGTAPLSLSIEFYLLNYRSDGPNLEKELKNLIKLSALAPGEGALKGVTAVPHGGYASDIFSNNYKSFFTKDTTFSNVNTSDLNQASSDLYSAGGYAKGAVTVDFGHKMSIRNLLVSRVNVTKSTTEVASFNGGNIKPLYYRVSVQFTGVRPLLTTDVDAMF